MPGLPIDENKSENKTNSLLSTCEKSNESSASGVDRSSSTSTGDSRGACASTVDFRTSGYVVRNSMIMLPTEGGSQEKINMPFAPVIKSASASPSTMEHAGEPASVGSTFSVKVTSPDKGEASPQTADVQSNKETIHHNEGGYMGDDRRVIVSHEASTSTAVPLTEKSQVIDAIRAAGREEESTYPTGEQEIPSLFKTVDQQPSKRRNFGFFVDNPIEPLIADGKTIDDPDSVADLGSKKTQNQEAPLTVDTEKQTEAVDTKPEGSMNLVAGTGDTLDPGRRNQATNLPPEGKSEPPISGGDGVSCLFHENQRHIFCPSDSFTGAKLGYVFKLGDQGLGFYLNGYVDSPTKGKRILVRRPWNAGPGDGVIRRGPLGPVHKPYKKVKTPHEHSEEDTVDEVDGTRAFMARIVAQRNSRAFQNSLLGRQQALDRHILALLENVSDPTFFKKKHGYNVHGQMLGKNGKMIVKPKAVKTEAEKAKLSWYRKIYEDRLGDHLSFKQLGDSIEARREAYAYSRHFTAYLNDREDELNRGLTKALKGQTKLDFIIEGFHYPGAYDKDGRLIHEKWLKRSNKVNQNDKQKERAFSYRFQATRLYRAAHEDIVNAIANTDKPLQAMFRKIDPIILQEIAEEAVESTGKGKYGQTNKGRGEHESKRKKSPVSVTTESPSQLREKFAEILETEIKSKDKALMKEVTAMKDKEIKQMVDDFGQGVEVLPSSWRQDPANLKYMQRRRKQLIAQFVADRRRVVSPWRPGGLHIAHEPWQPLTSKDHRPPIRLASEMKSVMIDSKMTEDGGRQMIRQIDGKPAKGARRPRTAPTHRTNDFMGMISVRAKRIVAAQTPGTPLLAAFSTYSNNSFKLKPRSPPKQSFRPAHDLRSQSNMGFQLRRSISDERQRRAWVELSRSSKTDGGLTGIENKGITRPHAAVADNNSRLCTTSRRLSTASRSPTPSCADEVDTTLPEHIGAKRRPGPSSRRELEHKQKRDERSTRFYLQSGSGVTVLSAQLCGPSSDVTYKGPTWPSTPRAPSAYQSTRQRARPSAKFATDKDGLPNTGYRRWEGIEDKETLGTRSGNDSREDVKISRGNFEALEDLEKSLFVTSWRRISQRKRVFSGYRIRSRRARIWDPGSIFFAEGVDGLTSSAARSPATRRVEVYAPEIASRGAIDGVSLRCREDRRWCGRAPLDADPLVDMDWKQVDTERFSHAAHEMREALEGRLFTVVTSDRSSGGELDECFRRAQELEEFAKRLFGYPLDKREKFEHECEGAFRIGKYVAAVSRLNRLRTAACGVVEIVGLVRRREELLQALCSQDDQLSIHIGANASEEAGEDIVQHSSTHISAGLSLACSLERKIRQYQERQALADFSYAILDSLKLWLSMLPWRIRVLYDGQYIVSKLMGEEKMVPWPQYPDLESVPNPEDKQAEETIICSEGNHMPLFGPHREVLSGSQDIILGAPAEETHRADSREGSMDGLIDAVV